MKGFTPTLAKVINRQAHTLAAQAFPAIRTKLEEKARAMLREGKSPEETMLAILAAGLQRGEPSL